MYVSKSEKKRPLRLEAASFSESSTVAAWFSTDADITEENHNALRKAVTIMQQHQCIDAKAPLLAKTLLLPLSKLWFFQKLRLDKKLFSNIASEASRFEEKFTINSMSEK